jgi:hypothetical protein
MTSRPRLCEFPWRAIMVASLVALTVALLPPEFGYARGVFWLPTKQASDATFDHFNPVLAAYHNHAYALSIRMNGSSPVTSVFFSTNESKHWVTTLLSNQGPKNSFGAEDVSLTADPSTGKLYATWVYRLSASQDAVGVWTRDSNGRWSGPVNIMTEGSLSGQPSIGAHNGKIYAAFTASGIAGACSDNRAGEVYIVASTGSRWSAPQNLTSCVSNASILSFDNPKLAVDEAGKVYLVTSANGDLWYADNAGGTWTNPSKITQGAHIPASVGSSLDTFYGLAASNGTEYVTYVRYIGASYDVLATAHGSSGSWSSPSRISPQDAHGCPKFGVSIVAHNGRVGVSYVRAHLGYCASSTGIFKNIPFVFTGGLGHMTSLGDLGSTESSCFSTSMATEGALFRFLITCDHVASLGKGQLYYRAELLDKRGPVARLFAPATSRAPAVGLRWSAKDPRPGSGVAYFELQVREGTGPWHTITGNTRATSLTYRKEHAGHHYSFRLRARDHTANWGKWVKVGSRAH